MDVIIIIIMQVPRFININRVLVLSMLLLSFVYYSLITAILASYSPLFYFFSVSCTQ